MKKKILVIEDDAVLKDNTAELLKLSGYDVITAADGRQGMALINNDRPDLVLCDIFMNGSGGYSVLQAKNQNTETAGIPLIFMTGKTDQAELRKGMELGADDFLFKPFQDIELLRAIETRINMREHLISKYLQDGTGKIVPLPELIQDILQEAVSIELKRGELLYRQDGASVAVYYIIKGSIKVYRISDQGKSYITDLASEGDIVGYKAAIENREYRQFAESMTPALVKRIPGEAFRDAVHKNKHLAAYLIKKISTQLTGKEQELMEMAYSSVRYRVGKKLLELINSSSQKFTDVPKITLAQMIGTTSETLVRTLNDFKNDGLIRSNGKKLYIDDMESFEHIISKY